MKLSSAGRFERSTSSQDAIEQALAFAGRQGLRVRFSAYGQSLHTIVCNLEGEGASKACGIGKGIGDQCKASALFEAIEHLYWAGSRPSDTAAPVPLDIAGQDAHLASGCPDFRAICGEHAVCCSRVPFHAIEDPADVLDFPFFLTHPFWESKHPQERAALNAFTLRRYSTNSGTAAGLTSADALLHALLEAIERDAIGVELLRTVVRKHPHPVRRVAQEALPSGLSDLMAAANQEGAEIDGIWNITASDIGVPAILVGVRDSETKRRYFGTGASLAPVYAAERALLEALQSMHMWRTKAPLPPQEELSPGAPAYLRCVLDRGFFGYRGGEVIEDLESLEAAGGNTANMSSGEQIHTICERLRTCGYRVFTRTLCGEFVHVEQVVVPELERFHLVTSRIPVLPGPRGNAVLAGK